MKPAASTIQDDIPPVHVLEAAERQDRKETEELLSGFDRPGRSPKPAPKGRDFVDYYAKKKGGAESGAARAVVPAPVIRMKQGDLSTVIVPRKSEGVPAWAVWGGAALVMLLVGGLVAFLATADGRPEATAPSVPSAASAATTLTGATNPLPTKADENIPPPGPPMSASAEVVVPEVVTAAAEPKVVTAPAARASAKRELRAVPSAVVAPVTPRETSAVGPSKPAPREDFIRDL